jgi:hypothetical protein
VGVPWGLWHLLPGVWVSATYAGLVPLAIYLPLNVLSGIAELTAYRTHMVWVYDGTQSLLVTVLIHASDRPERLFRSGRGAVVGAVVVANHARLTQEAL